MRGAGELGIRFIQGLCAAWPAGPEQVHLRGDLAMLYFHLHREAEAEQCCLELIHDHPDSATGYVDLSDGLLRSSMKGVPDPARCQRAIQILEQALAYPAKDADDYDVSARLADARALLSKAAPP